MSYEQTERSWWAAAGNTKTDAEHYNDLAEWCEQLKPSEQRQGFDRVLNQLADFGADADGDRKDVATHWISRLVDSGAFESAAIALIPRTAIYTGGRMKDGSFVAQVIPEDSAGAHSRQAQSLAMAWLAALLRALARQSAEAKGAVMH